MERPVKQGAPQRGTPIVEAIVVAGLATPAFLPDVDEPAIRQEVAGLGAAAASSPLLSTSPPALPRQEVAVAVIPHGRAGPSLRDRRGKGVILNALEGAPAPLALAAAHAGGGVRAEGLPREGEACQLAVVWADTAVGERPLRLVSPG